MHTDSRWVGKVRKESMKSDRLTTLQRLKLVSEPYSRHKVRISVVRRVDKVREAVSRVKLTLTYQGFCFYLPRPTPCRTSSRVAARLLATNSAFTKTVAFCHRRASGLPATKSRQTLVRQI